MKKALLISILSLIFVINSVSAQDPLTNLRKYWHYRYRLVNYFMVVGDGPGKSLPAGIRNLYNGDQMHWGEVPVYLGWYIGVLATEYRLLKDNNQPVDRTLTELFYALKAAKRLDGVAETVAPWNTAVAPAINGFLIRDDVPADFVQQHYAELNQSSLSSNVTVGSGKPAVVQNTVSDFADNIGNACSQDVIYHLFLGYALVKQFVDDGLLSFYDYVANQNVVADIKSFAIAHADEIVDRNKRRWMVYQRPQWK
jgi:hypothetical protein